MNESSQKYGEMRFGMIKCTRILMMILLSCYLTGCSHARFDEDGNRIYRCSGVTYYHTTFTRCK